MSRQSSGITSRPTGSVGADTFQRGRDRHHRTTIVRSKPVPLDPKTTLQERNRDRFAIAQDLAKLCGKSQWGNAWQSGRRKRAGYQRLTGYLRDNLVYTMNFWRYPATLPQEHLGASYGPSVALFTNNVSFQWPTATEGDHAAPEDQLQGFFFPRRPQELPHDEAFGPVRPGTTRADIIYFFHADHSSVTTPLMGLLWFMHQEGSSRIYSPTFYTRVG